MDTFDNFQSENSSAYGGMSVIDDNSSVYTDNTREDIVSNIDLSSMFISDTASQSNGSTGLAQSSATIDEDFDAVLDDLKDDGIVDLPPHACR
jgi:regulator of nonsense transcripts 1